MHKRILTIWPLTALSVIGMGFLGAAEQNNKDSSGMVDHSVNPTTRTYIGMGWVAEVDFFVWKAYEGGLSPVGFDVVCLSSSTSSPASNYNDGEIEHLHFKWRPGVRIGLGRNLSHDEWDIYADFTHYHDKARREIQSFLRMTAAANTASANAAPGATAAVAAIETPEALYPLFSAINAPGLRATLAEAHWKLYIDMIDFELGRKFFVGKWLSLRPNIGLRNAWVRQRYNIVYKGLSSTSTSSTDATLLASDDFVHMKNYYWGLGPRFGLNTQWNMAREWSFFGDAALSVLYGRFRVNQEEQLGPCALFVSSGGGGGPSKATGTVNAPFASSSGRVDTRILDIEDAFHATRLITDLILGIRWEHEVPERGFKVTLNLGWEHHFFFHQNQFKHISSKGEERSGNIITTIPGGAALNSSKGVKSPAFETFKPAPVRRSVATTKTDIVPDYDQNLATQGWTLSLRFDF